MDFIKRRRIFPPYVIKVSCINEYIFLRFSHYILLFGFFFFARSFFTSFQLFSHFFRGKLIKLCVEAVHFISYIRVCVCQNGTVFHCFNSDVHSNFPFSCRTQIKYYPMHTRYSTQIAQCFLQGTPGRPRGRINGENVDVEHFFNFFFWLFFVSMLLKYPIVRLHMQECFFRCAFCSPILPPFRNDEGCLVSYYYNNGDNTQNIRQPKHFVYVLTSSVFVHILIKLELAHKGKYGERKQMR